MNSEMLSGRGILLALVIILAGCGASDTEATDVKAAAPVSIRQVSLTPSVDTGRWYTNTWVEEGKTLFAQYCAACHGDRAQATPDWMTLDENGNYPPPPLNGTAHAWHHPLAELEMVIKQGGAPFGGVMPGWEAVLSDQDIVKIIASFQSYWSDEIYAMWLDRETLYRDYRATPP